MLYSAIEFGHLASESTTARSRAPGPLVRGVTADDINPALPIIRNIP